MKETPETPSLGDKVHPGVAKSHRENAGGFIPRFASQPTPIQAAPALEPTPVSKAEPKVCAQCKNEWTGSRAKLIRRLDPTGLFCSIVCAANAGIEAKR